MKEVELFKIYAHAKAPYALEVEVSILLWSLTGFAKAIYLTWSYLYFQQHIGQLRPLITDTPPCSCLDVLMQGHLLPQTPAT